MSRVEIFNQIGKKGLCVGPMRIDREPSGVNYSRISDWSQVCDDVDEILKAGTRQTRIYKIGNFVILGGMFLGILLLTNVVGFINIPFFWAIATAAMTLTFVLYFVVMKRINAVMNDLKILLESRGSNTISYELEHETPKPCVQQYYIVVHGANVDGVESDPTAGTTATTTTTSATSGTNTMIVSNAVVVPSTTSTMPTSSTNAVAPPEPSTAYSTTTTTINNANNKTGTSIFDQLNSAV